jgi:nitrogen-specific signal transduction histidine kinase
LLVDSARGGIGLRRRRGVRDRLEAAQLSAALEGSSQPLLIVDECDRICFANSAVARLLGVRTEHLLQAHLRDHLLSLDRSGSWADGMLQRLEHGPCTLELSLPDGRGVRARLTSLCDAWGEPSHVCIGLEEAKPQGAEAALDALGRLAGELAHDINNQLSAALNYIFILQRRLGRDGPLTNHLDELQAAAWRAAAIAGSLRLVGGKRSVEPLYLQLDETIEGLAPLLMYLARDVRLELSLERGQPEIRAPLPYLEQVVVIAMLYALGRAPAGSTLRLETRTSQPGPGVAPRARLLLELVTDEPLTPSRSREAMSHANGALRRALKRCQASLGHDDRRVWVDFVSRWNARSRFG